MARHDKKSPKAPFNVFCILKFFQSYDAKFFMMRMVRASEMTKKGTKLRKLLIKYQIKGNRQVAKQLKPSQGHFDNFSFLNDPPRKSKLIFIKMIP